MTKSMENDARWRAYKSVGKMRMPEMDKDFILNCIVNDTDKRIKGMTTTRIIKTAMWRLKRMKSDRARVMQGVCPLLAVSLV